MTILRNTMDLEPIVIAAVIVSGGITLHALLCMYGFFTIVKKFTFVRRAC